METLQNIFQATIVQRLGWTLVHFVWQAAAIAVILAIALKLLRKGPANLRYIIACMALAAIVLMPVVTIWMVDVSIEAIDPVKLKQAGAEFAKIGAGTEAIVTMPEVELPVGQMADRPKGPLKDRFIEAVEPALPYVVVGWLVGVFGLSLWHLGGWRQLQRLRRQMVKEVGPGLKEKLLQLSNALGIWKTIGLVESSLVQVPSVVGHLRPMILLPASALTGLSTEQIEAILAHELAHIKRCDYLVNMLQTVVEILGFYHPGVWWVSHKIRVERENCCDDIAVSVCSDRVCYARALTSMEEIRSSQPTLAVAASGGSLLMRIRRLLGKDSANEGKISWLPSVIAVLLIGALLIPTALALSSRKERETNFIVTMPNGVSVELVGLCEHPSEGKQWWRPDGSLLNKGFNIPNRLRKSRSGRPFVLVSKVKGPDDMKFIWKIHDSRGSSGLQANDENGREIKELKVQKVQFPENIEQTSVTLGASTASWRTVATYKDGKTSGEELSKWKIQISEPKKGRLARKELGGPEYTQADVTSKFHNFDCRLIAIDHEGNTHPFPGYGSNTSNDKIEYTFEFLRLDVDQIRELHYQVRPYEWVTFKNVSLRPGKKTDMVMEIGEPAKRIYKSTLLESRYGKSAPELKDIKGWLYSKPLKLSDLRGKIVLLDFWGYWCGPCIHSMPHLIELHKQFSEKDLVIIAIHDDSVASVEELEKKISEMSKKNNWGGEKLPFAVALDGGGLQQIKGSNISVRGTTTATYGIYAFPSAILIDRKGEIIKKFHPSETEIDDELAKIFDKESAKNPDVQVKGETNSPQILTSGYILSVPADLPQLKEILPNDKTGSGTPMITGEKLEEFLKVIDTVPQARVIAAPKLLTNDGEVGEIRTESAENFESIKLNIKNTVAADKKTVRLKLDFEYLVSAEKGVESVSVSTVAAVLSGHAIAIAGGVSKDQVILLLVKPEVLERQSSKTGVVDTDNDKKDFRSQKETVGPSDRRPTGNCSISGKVFSAQDGKPVDKAKVYLFCLATHDAIFIEPAGDGTFEFKDIPSGGYFLSVIHTPGFQNQQYNPENSTGQSKQFSLKDGEQRSGIVFELKRAFTISGKVFDENGQPYSTGHSKVIVWRQSTKDGGPGDLYNPNGHPSKIDSDGSYLIEALDGNSVYVMVYDYDSDKKDDYHPPCYYPGTVLRNEAKLISFDSQPNVQNIDIHLEKTDGLVLKGTIVDETGKPVPEAFVTVHHREMLFDFVTAYTNEQGNYEIQGIGGGELLAHVDAVHRGFVRTRTPIDIDTSNKITQLDFTLKHGVTISGKFVNTNDNDWEIGNSFGHAHIKNYPSPNSSFVRTGFRNKYRPRDVKESFGATFLPGHGDYGSGSMIFPTKSTFIFQGMMPGKTLITFSPKQEGQEVLKILCNGQNILKSGIETEAGQDIKDVIIIIRTDSSNKETSGLFELGPAITNLNETGVVDTDELKSEKAISKKGEIEITARFLESTEDDHEIKDFLEREKIAYPSDKYDPNYTSELDDEQVNQLLKLIKTAKGSQLLASPKVKVLDGEEAAFEIIAEIPYTCGYSEPNETFDQPQRKLAFANRGIMLKVKPIVKNENIDLDINYEFSNITGYLKHVYKEKYPYKIPIIQKFVTDTRAFFSLGQTILLGGQKTQRENKDGKTVDVNLLVLIKAEKVEVSEDEER